MRVWKIDKMNDSKNSKNHLENEILIGRIRKNGLKHKLYRNMDWSFGCFSVVQNEPHFTC